VVAKGSQETWRWRLADRCLPHAECFSWHSANSIRAWLIEFRFYVPLYTEWIIPETFVPAWYWRTRHWRQYRPTVIAVVYVEWSLVISKCTVRYALAGVGNYSGTFLSFCWWVCAFGRTEPREKLPRFSVSCHTPRSCLRARDASAREGKSYSADAEGADVQSW